MNTYVFEFYLAGKWHEYPVKAESLTEAERKVPAGYRFKYWTY